MRFARSVLVIGLAGARLVAQSVPRATPPIVPLSTAWVAANPDQARDTVRQWLAGSASVDPAAAAAMLARATRLASEYGRVWGDSFLVREAQRFAGWPREKRTRRVRADSLRRSGNVALGAAGLEAALADWRSSLAIGQALADTGVIAAALGNMGAGYYRVGDLSRAEPLFTEAHRLARLAGDRRTMLNGLGGLASIHKDRGELRQAASVYLTALTLSRQIGDFRGVAADANNLGLVSVSLGDLPEAKRRHTEALITARQHGLDEAAAAALVNLGALAADLGRESEAEARYLEALDLYRRLAAADDEALVLHNLGLLDAGRGDFSKARDRYLAAAILFEKAGPAESAVAARRDLSTIFAAMGELALADQQLMLAVEMARVHQLSPAAEGRLDLARGDLALAYNQLKRARTAYDAGLVLFRRGRDGAGEADALGSLGALRLLEEDYAGAVPLLTDAATRQQALGDRRSASLTRLLIAQAGQLQGDTAGANRNIREAVDALHAAGDRVSEAWALCQAGRYQQAIGLPLAAEGRFRAGLDRLGPRPATSVTVCLTSGLGGVLRLRGAQREAQAALVQGIKEVESAAFRVAQPGRRADFLADKWSLYADLALAQRATGDDAAAFATSERLRARQTLDLLTSPASARLGSAPSDNPRADALRRRISALIRTVEAPGTSVALRGADALDLFSNGDREALRRAQDAYAELLDSLQISQTDVARPPSGTPGWREVATRLGADQALIEYLVTDSAVVAFVVTAERLATVNLPVSGRTLGSEVAFVRGLLQPSAIGRSATWEAPLRRLHAQLIAPLEAAGLLARRQRLIVVPHGELHYLPFAALLEGGAGGRYLVDRYSLGSVSSAAVWLELGRRPTRSGPDKMLALSPGIRDLPGANTETAALAALYGPSARILSGPVATRRAFIEAARSYSILHIATVGVLNKHNPAFSYVALAPERDADGRLEVRDVAQLVIDARLVVLSACQTGLGSGRMTDVPAGDDWVGLVQSFQAAGARNVIATLWPVDDRATADLMRDFYGELRAGRSELDALAAAQRRALRRAGTGSPFYWAGFVLDGRLT